MTTQLRYGFGKTVELPFDHAIERVTNALQAEGFGVLTEIDVQATLKRKLDRDVLPHHILGACNPALADRALAAEPSVGLLLPCNVVVRLDQAGRVHVEIQDPSLLADLTGNAGLTDVAREARERLERVLRAL